MLVRYKKLTAIIFSIVLLSMFLVPVIQSVDAQGLAGQAVERVKNNKAADATTDDTTETESTGTADAISNVIGWIFFYIASFFSWLVSLMVQVMVLVASYNNFINTDIVSKGWIIVRDVANNFFIIILLVIAVGTILQVPTYNRQLLPKLLIMAILINFSKMFTGILIDFSQVITLWFVAAIDKIGGQGNILLYALGLSDLYAIDASNYAWTDNVPFIEDGDIIKTMLFAVILSVVAVVVITIITIILVYRIVMLWFLVILSPLAYLLSTFPKGQQYAGMWWSELTKYLVVGPVMLFFLYLSFFSGSVNLEDPSSSAGTGTNPVSVSEVVSVNPDGTGSVDRNNGGVVIPKNTSGVSLGLSNKQSPAGMFDFLIIIGLMVGSLVAGQKTGAAGAQWAGKGVSTLQRWGKKSTVGAALGASRLADRKLGLSQKAYNAGGGRIPLVRTALGNRVGQINDERNKLEKSKIDSAASALKGKSAAELVSLSQKTGPGSRYNRIAAAQKLAQDGELRDDKNLTPTERKRRIDTINRARQDLATTPELQGVLDENIRKNAPSLALASNMYKKDDGSFNTDKMAKDANSGKLDIGKALSGADASDLASIKAAVGGQDDSIVKYLMKNIRDEKELSKAISGIKGDAQKAIFDGVKRDTFKKDDGTIDDELRSNFLKASEHANVTKVFDKYDRDDREKYEKHYEANKSDIKKNMSSDEVKQLSQDMSHMMTQKDIDDLKAKGKDFKDAVEKGLEEAIKQISFSDYSNPDKRNEIKKKYENGLLGGAHFDMDSGNIDQSILAETLGGKNKKAMLERMNTKNINQQFLASSYKNLKAADFKTIGGVSDDHKQALKSAFTSTIKSIDPRTPDGAEMTKQFMQHATSVGADIDITGQGMLTRKNIFDNEVAQSLDAEALRNGKFKDSTGQIDAIAEKGDINAIRSFFRDSGGNTELARALATRIRAAGGSRASKLSDYL